MAEDRYQEDRSQRREDGEDGNKLPGEEQGFSSPHGSVFRLFHLHADIRYLMVGV
jgi:hypothetical protein